MLLSLLFSWFPSVPPAKCWVCTLNLGYGHLLSYACQFMAIIWRYMLKAADIVFKWTTNNRQAWNVPLFCNGSAVPGTSVVLMGGDSRRSLTVPEIPAPVVSERSLCVICPTFYVVTTWRGNKQIACRFSSSDYEERGQGREACRGSEGNPWENRSGSSLPSCSVKKHASQIRVLLLTSHVAGWCCLQPEHITLHSISIVIITSICMPLYVQHGVPKWQL
jgi:hypothetical protein